MLHRGPAGLADAGLAHLAYYLIWVVLPGVVVWRHVAGRRLGWMEALAVGAPIGHCWEIIAYTVATAGGVRGLHVISPVVALALLWWGRNRCAWPRIVSRPRLREAAAPGAIFAIALAMSVLTTIGYFFKDATVTQGWVPATTHHDWVYLVSRLAEIRNHWPWQEPSQLGAGLSYHYFFLVHLAAAGEITARSSSELLLRTGLVPISGVVLAQVYWLGRRLTRRRLGGVLALGFFALSAFEFTSGQDNGVFMLLLGWWLRVSPTFFFGFMFFGAGIILLYRYGGRRRIGVAGVGLFVLFATIATGAKGTTIPPLAVAFTLWSLVRALRVRAALGRAMVIGGAMTAGFAIVYFVILSAWGTGGAAWRWGVTFQITGFWENAFPAWTAVLTKWLPADAAARMAFVACTGLMIVLLHGARVWGFVHLAQGRFRPNPALATLLGWVVFASWLMGWSLYLDSNNQLYFLLPWQMPLAVLAAGGVLGFADRRRGFWAPIRYWLHGHTGPAALAGTGVISVALVYFSGLPWWCASLPPIAAFMIPSSAKAEAADAVENAVAWSPASWVKGWGALILLSGTVLVAAVQLGHWKQLNRSAWLAWWREETQPLGTMPDLNAAMVWVRENTPVDAVLVADAFRGRWFARERLPVVDNTTVDKYYFYTALSGRRLWVEGPTYLRDQDEARRRMAQVERLLAEGPTALPGERSRDEPWFLLIDHDLPPVKPVGFAWQNPVFSNRRISIYRLN